ncbi:hypothetical protein CAC01_16955 [Streptomyces sp. CLI2509]|nr:hypothetical protein CAC01_16955 [Streptomyces sp. CLI2509]
MSLTVPVSLKPKATSWTSPSLRASRPLGSFAEALPSPPMMTLPCAGTESEPEPLAGLRSACSPPTASESRVCALALLLKTVARIAAGPLASRSGWVTTVTFWTLTSPTEVAALSGFTSSVWALLPAPQAASVAIENARAEAARAPRRRLLLTAAATP